jgi:hypothetical protein
MLATFWRREISVAKQSKTLATLSLPKRRLFFCKGNLMISANIAQCLQGKTKVNYVWKHRKYIDTLQGKIKEKSLRSSLQRVRLCISTMWWSKIKMAKWGTEPREASPLIRHQGIHTWPCQTHLMIDASLGECCEEVSHSEGGRMKTWTNQDIVCETPKMSKGVWRCSKVLEDVCEVFVNVCECLPCSKVFARCLWCVCECLKMFVRCLWCSRVFAKGRTQL